VTTTLADLADGTAKRGAKKIRTESGIHSMSRKGKEAAGSAYAKWQERTQKSIGGWSGGGGGDDGNSAGGGLGTGIGSRMALPKTKQAKHQAKVARKAEKEVVHKDAKNELKSAKKIREERAKKEEVRIKNMPKDKRKHVIEKRKAEWKAKVARKEEEVRNPYAVVVDGFKRAGGGKSKKKGKR